MDTTNPYASPETATRPTLNPVGSLGGLGSLAQLAREKELGQARWTLILIGLLMAGFHAYQAYNVPNEVAESMRKGDLDTEFRVVASALGYVLYGGAAVVGLVFIGLGAMIKKFPVFATVTGLVLYIIAALLFTLSDLASDQVGMGLFIRIMIAFGLFRAAKSAIAYKREAAVADADEAFLA